MGKIAPPQWFKDACATYRAMKGKGDLSPSELLDLLADDIQDRHEEGEPFGRLIWIDYISRYDKEMKQAADEAAAEAQAIAAATGFMQIDMFPREVLDELGLPMTVDLGWDKKAMTPDLDWDGFQKAIEEVERKEISWSTSLSKQKSALKRGQALVPADNSKTLRQVIANPDEYGTGTL